MPQTTPVKLWRHCRKRIAKKRLGPDQWRKLQFGRTLAPGDLVSACVGWNVRITSIYPVWQNWGPFAGRLIVDFGIQHEAGGCSMDACCEDHLQARDEIVAYWMRPWSQKDRDWYEQWSGGEQWEDSGWGRIQRALMEGQRVFADDGTWLGYED